MRTLSPRRILGVLTVVGVEGEEQRGEHPFGVPEMMVQVLLGDPLTGGAGTVSWESFGPSTRDGVERLAEDDKQSPCIRPWCGGDAAC